MSDGWSDFRRIVSSSGIYALAAVAQRGVAFFLLPVYTRYLDPAEYGVLELLNALAAVVFACLMLGLPSAIVKSYHRDAGSAEERARVLPTALGVGVPVLVLGTALLIALAPAVSRLLVGSSEHADLVRLMAAGGLLSSIAAVVLASLRAEERATAFAVLSLAQFVAAVSLNVVLVVELELGVAGVLWGNLVSNAVAVPLALLVVRRPAGAAISRRLVAPLLRFGLLLVPGMLAGWVIDLSDRYLLRLFSGLEEVAVYGVGYKVGMVLQLAVVWPFQLAWPAVSFGISEREGHRETYARTLTHLSALMAFGVLALSLLSRGVLPALVGEGFGGAWRVVPLVALAYALNGVHFCAAPGVHLSGRTRWLPLLAAGAAALNFGLNLLLIPRWGMLGAAWATVAAFAGLAAGTLAIGQRFYPVPYEVGRLVKIAVAGLAVYALGTRVAPAPTAFSIGWHAAMLAGFPLALAALGFLDRGERAALGGLIRRLPRPAARHGGAGG